jgi:predicted transposase/invertase (TIGR01784 family)
MRRDPLFYKLFQQRPELLFELLGERPANADRYRFDSVAVKEPKFEIDGVFLPPAGEDPGIVFFCEVQMQKDEKLYERSFSESMLYFYQNAEKFSDWQAVIIYPARTAEQSKVHPHRSLLNGEQVHRIYLDELGDSQELPIPVAALVLTITPEKEATAAARNLLFRNETSELSAPEKQGIIDIVTSIILYKFTNLSQREVRAMLGLDLTQEPRAIREAKEESREQEAIALVTRLLTRRLGEALPEWTEDCLPLLPLGRLEDLAEALLDFRGLRDLLAWLSQPEVLLGMLEKHFGAIDDDLKQQILELPGETVLDLVQRMPTLKMLEEVEAILGK